MNIGVDITRARGVSLWSPRRLFAAGEPGFLARISPETCFTDTAATIPAGPGDPVAIVLDGSGNGNHLTQATPAARPRLGRKPKGGRRNLFENTEGLADPYWTNSDLAVVPVDGVIWRIEANGTDSSHRLRRASIVPASQPFIFSAEVKADTTDKVRLSLRPVGLDPYVEYDLSNGTILDINMGSGSGRLEGGTANIAPLGDGWWHVWVSAPEGRAVNTPDPQIAVLNNAGDFSYAGNGEAVLVRHMQFENYRSDGIPSPYQRVGSTFDVTEQGRTDRWYLSFGGDADPRWMQTPVIEPGTDKAQVFTGIRGLDLTDTEIGMLFELGATGFNALTVRVPTGIVAGRILASHSGDTAIRAANETGLVAPLDAVLSAISDIEAPNLMLRRNGTLSAQNISLPGTGNFQDRAIFIGSQGGTTRYFHGEVYALIARFGPNLPAAEIERTERYTTTLVAEDTI